jgi:uncharacterized membrane protein
MIEAKLATALCCSNGPRALRVPQGHTAIFLIKMVNICAVYSLTRWSLQPYRDDFHPRAALLLIRVLGTGPAIRSPARMVISIGSGEGIDEKDRGNH